MSYTLAITSCNRHDLLKRTVESFLECVSQNPSTTVILEDGPATKPEWLDALKPRLGVVKWINNIDRMGQSYSIDRLYQEISTEYIFWLEDDWEFHEANFLQPSFQILRAHPEVSMVALRSDWNHPVISGAVVGESGGAEPSYSIAEPYWHGVWGGTCWNPGLRRLSDYKRFGSYGRHVGYGTHGLGHEKVWSKLHLDNGYRIAVLPHHCRHIGGERSRAIEPLENRLPRVLVAVPACRSFDYGRWESGSSPHYNPTHKAYGSDIHISHRANDRIQAVRDTWWKDIETFPNVEGRFFYGHGNKAEAPDEVILPCGDNYAALPAKTIEICKWALANNFDYVFKCDDDTICLIHELVKELIENKIEYGGNDNCGVCTGGPGYILSKRAMRAVVVAGPQGQTWAEDVAVSHAVSQANIQATHLPGHCAGYSEHWFFPQGFNPGKLLPGMVTAHAVKPDDMRAWHKYISEVK